MSRILPRRTTTLSDGRTLSYIEAGDPDGVPLLFTIGTPSSATGGLAFASAAARNGVKLISIDKPGYGQSTRDRNRSLVRYGQDVAALADSLGLERVALAGQSGGGPHALAAAHVLGSRVSTLTLISSFGPATETWVRPELAGQIKIMTMVSQHAPGFMGVVAGLMKILTGNRAHAERMVKHAAAKATPTEREALTSPELQFILDGYSEAYSSIGAVRDELHAIGVPWGFDLEGIGAPTDLWHGTEDNACSITMARGIAYRLPRSTLHELPGLGHSFFGRALDDALANVRAKAIQL